MKCKDCKHDVSGTLEELVFESGCFYYGDGTRPDGCKHFTPRFTIKRLLKAIWAGLIAPFKSSKNEYGIGE